MGKRTISTMEIIVIIIVFAIVGVSIMSYDPSPAIGFEVEGQGSINYNNVNLVDSERETFEYGEDLVIEAVPEEGWTFEKWRGDLPEELADQSQIELTVDDFKILEAVFLEE